MKKILLMSLCLLITGPAMAAKDAIKSLRAQSLEVQDPAQKLKNYPRENLNQPLSYIQQPPLIPHQIRGYQIDRKANKCLSCHSFKNFQRYDATKISVSHFLNRDSQALADVSPRRYFCLQCHVPQVKAKPLVENSFQPTAALKK